MRRTGDLKLIQELNRSIILDMIRKEAPISRSEIAKRINISPTTVTSAVNELMNEGFVREDGIGVSNGGRKPVLLRFDPNSHFIIGVSISNSYIKVAEMNLEAEIRRKAVYSTNLHFGQAVIDHILEIIKQFLQNTDNMERCVGISVITPGIVDADKGIISYNTKLNLNHVPLKKLIEQQFGLKTYLDNDTNSFVLAEKHFGSYSHYKDVIYITVGDGVGSGLMINGSIHRGYRGSSGELGHTTVNRGSGVKCECGNIGCLESYVNWPAIYSKILTAILTRGQQTKIQELVPEELSQITPEIFIKAINMGDLICLKIMDEVVSYLSAGIVNYIHLFNPEVIILGGNMFQDNPLFIEAIQEEVSRHVIPSLKDDIRILPTTLGPEFEMMGAAAVLLQEKFRSPGFFS
ncbi:ROK family transcriptional regulator [Bacillus sp. CMF21]|uniref:ROK family transcriptional regulator n=1 Tax=Metabacillus dongyingensis TaxID=2874282 RepID=UPI001CBFA567|nr:ROK family transcriptional regulator [Metabacillus dongyingensis]UAL53642.1 ROK family transcriptional regulator [Metabacillus dongyingensis]USK29953.1 ROK family transcriptional regulator [Bacillus sp. CMF21]